MPVRGGQRGLVLLVRLSGTEFRRAGTDPTVACSRAGTGSGARAIPSTQ